MNPSPSQRLTIWLCRWDETGSYHIARTAKLVLSKRFVHQRKVKHATSLKPREPCQCLKQLTGMNSFLSRTSWPPPVHIRPDKKRNAYLIGNICFLIPWLPIRPSFLTSSSFHLLLSLVQLKLLLSTSLSCFRRPKWCFILL